MSRLLEAIAEFRSGGAAYAGPLVLVRWAENNTGRTVTFRLDDGPDADAIHPFKGMFAHPKDGARFVAVLVAVGDVAEEPPAVEVAESAALPEQKERRKRSELPFVTRAGMLIGKPLFWRWLNETWFRYPERPNTAKCCVENKDEADAEMKFRIGGIISKHDLDKWPEAAERFVNLIEEPFTNYERSGLYALEAAQ